jgi:hypothetical protein
MRKVTLVVVAIVLLASDAEAGLFRRRARVCSSSSCQVTPVQKADVVQKEPVQKDAVQKGTTNAVVVTEGSALYRLALRKAQIQASRGGRCFHPGGGFGGARAEGVGSASTAQGALNNCCFSGQRRCAAAAVVQSSNGRFYACKLFW